MLLFYKIKENLSGFTSLKEPVNFSFFAIVYLALLFHILCFICVMSTVSSTGSLMYTNDKPLITNCFCFIH